MTTKVITICDHCGKEIPNLKGAFEVRVSKDSIYEDSVNGKRLLSNSETAGFNFHEGCGQRVLEFWDDLNAGRMEAIRG